MSNIVVFDFSFQKYTMRVLYIFLSHDPLENIFVIIDAHKLTYNSNKACRFDALTFGNKYISGSYELVNPNKLNMFDFFHSAPLWQVVSWPVGA